MSSMLEHMDAYYLRRILRSLFRTVIFNFNLGQDELLLKLGIGKTPMHAYKLHDNGQSEPAAAKVLHDLVSLVHNHVGANQDQQSLSASVNVNELRESDKCEKKVNFNWRDDPIAKILWDVESQTLQNVFLAMAHNFSRTLEAFVLHVLSPIGAEVISQKIDEMDQQILEEDRSRFYEVFFSAFDDQSAAMNLILKGKESFTQQAFKSVMGKFVGLRLESSKPGSDEMPS
ncbi:hypothetical protein TanjilG_24582 [Lupinus angustifolius]|uniref:Uncharacterized protein n=1 Tax=Lupinus angustifolius TaxID=3871 RepID=A0A4P1RKD2_LUPAN|nr:hypothetical protein TanjilG_24582 [Lupinus angustifolius]